MPNIFSPKSTGRFYGAIALIAVVAALILGGLYYANFYVRDYEPVQPVAFSHKQHAGDLKMGCTACHSAAVRSARAGIPDTQSCLGCHRHILPNSPRIAPLRRAADPDYPGYTGEPIRWVAVNRLAGHARFSHAAHVNRGVGCTTCHENVAASERVSAPQDSRMKWCMDCHRNPTPNLRPLEEITAPDYNAAEFIKKNRPKSHTGQFITTPEELQQLLHQQWKINPGTDCTGCHQ